MRRMCSVCYMIERAQGTHIDYPTVNRRAVDLIESADELLNRGCTNQEVADILGVKWASIVTARWRLRRRAQRHEKEENSEADI